MTDLEQIALEPVDALSVTVLMDNAIDMLLVDEGLARRPVIGSGPRVAAPLLDLGETFAALRAERGFSTLVTVVRGGRKHRLLFDIAFDRRGRLHVLEVFKNGLPAPPPAGELPPGRLVRVERNGGQTEIAAGALSKSGSFAFGRDGSIYVSNKSAACRGAGEILRIRSRP